MSAFQRSSLQNLVLGVSSLEAAGLLLLVWNGIFLGSDPATRGLDRDLALLAGAMLVLISAPALVLATPDRLLWLAALLTVAPIGAISGSMAWFTLT